LRQRGDLVGATRWIKAARCRRDGISFRYNHDLFSAKNHHEPSRRSIRAVL
jgi:hypothetical protein